MILPRCLVMLSVPGLLVACGRETVPGPSDTAPATGRAAAVERASEQAAEHAPVAVTAAGSVVISEVCAINHSGLMDNEGDRPDWIEIHNPTGAPRQLQGLFLTDSRKTPAKWAFPDFTLDAGAYLVVFASGKNRSHGRPAEMHANFKLDGDGEYLALQRDGQVIDALRYPRLFSDITFGRCGGRNGFLAEPTPARANDALLPAGGPAIVDVRHEIMRATPGQASRSPAGVRVTARIAADAPETIVTLHYKVMFGRAVAAPMRDDGAGGDTTGGDRVFTVELAAGTLAGNPQVPEGMLRYHVTASAAGDPTTASRAPSPLSGDPNRFFAVLLAHESAHESAHAPGLPVIHWFVEDPDAAESRDGSPCTVFLDGNYHENVHCRIRGATSVQWTKKSFKFLFPRESLFRPRGGPPASEFNLNTTVQDKAYLREALAYEMYRRCGVPAPLSYNVRVNRNGAFHSVATVVEQIDERFLERNGIAVKGSLLYKVIDSREDYMEIEQKLAGTPDSAHVEFLAAMRRARDTGDAGDVERLLFAEVDVPAMVNYLAAGTVIHDWDRPFHNYYLFRDAMGRWRMFPWDKDLTLGEVWRSDSISGNGAFGHPFYGSLGSGKEYNVVFDAIYSNPSTRQMYLRRLRTLMDQYLQPASTPPEQRWFEQRIDTLSRPLAADAARDLDTWGSDVIRSQRQHVEFPEAIRQLKEIFLNERRHHLYTTHGPGSSTGIPQAQAGFERILKDIVLKWDEGTGCLVLENLSDAAIDLSSLQLSGPVVHAFQPGTALAPAGMTGAQLFLAARPPRPTGAGAVFWQLLEKAGPHALPEKPPQLPVLERRPSHAEEPDKGGKVDAVLEP